jgi:hypothetical protein
MDRAELQEGLSLSPKQGAADRDLGRTHLNHALRMMPAITE